LEEGIAFVTHGGKLSQLPSVAIQISANVSFSPTAFIPDYADEGRIRYNQRLGRIFDVSSPWVWIRIRTEAM